ncbi:unnamed protein product, partial [Mesorhabditis spiculigera]
MIWLMEVWGCIPLLLILTLPLCFKRITSTKSKSSKSSGSRKACDASDPSHKAFKPIPVKLIDTKKSPKKCCKTAREQRTHCSFHLNVEQRDETDLEEVEGDNPLARKAECQSGMLWIAKSRVKTGPTQATTEPQQQQQQQQQNNKTHQPQQPLSGTRLRWPLNNTTAANNEYGKTQKKTQPIAMNGGDDEMMKTQSLEKIVAPETSSPQLDTACDHSSGYLSLLSPSRN